jgi:hypothetical protein
VMMEGGGDLAASFEFFSCFCTSERSVFRFRLRAEGVTADVEELRVYVSGGRRRYGDDNSKNDIPHDG